MPELDSSIDEVLGLFEGVKDPDNCPSEGTRSALVVALGLCGSLKAGEAVGAFPSPGLKAEPPGLNDEPLGILVGSFDGCTLGSKTENVVGASVGTDVGKLVGDSVGDNEGEALGVDVGR